MHMHMHMHRLIYNPMGILRGIHIHNLNLMPPKHTQHSCKPPLSISSLSLPKHTHRSCKAHLSISSLSLPKHTHHSCKAHLISSSLSLPNNSRSKCHILRPTPSISRIRNIHSHSPNISHNNFLCRCNLNHNLIPIHSPLCRCNLCSLQLILCQDTSLIHNLSLVLHSSKQCTCNLSHRACHPSNSSRPTSLLRCVLPLLKRRCQFISNLPCHHLKVLTMHRTHTLAPPRSDLVNNTCNATTYNDFCISTLSSSPDTPKATTVKSLAIIIINFAMSNATNTSSFASSLSKTTPNPSLSSLLRTCADKYVHARESLQSSLGAMSDEDYDYAFVHVSAAAEYPNVCRVLFRRNPAAKYPAEMARREEVMERLCAVALDIISFLG